MHRFATLVLAIVITVTAHAAPLKLANTVFPDVNCKFDTDCTIFVTDLADHFTLGEGAGDAFLQSRSWPPGDEGTPGAGLHAYLYRVDLREMAGVLSMPCIRTLKIDFGVVSPLDYDGDTIPDDIFVATGGGLGSIAPYTAEKVGNAITFHFSAYQAVCGGSYIGGGDSSFFFGLASTGAPTVTTAIVKSYYGESVTLQARTPQLGFFTQIELGLWKYLLYLLGVLALLTVVYFVGRKRRT